MGARQVGRRDPPAGKVVRPALDVRRALAVVARGVATQGGVYESVARGGGFREATVGEDIERKEHDGWVELASLFGEVVGNVG